MKPIVAAILILTIIVFIWLVYKKRSEVLVNEIDWEEMSRGLNYDAKNIKPSDAVKTLREMELAQTSDISVFP